MANASQSSNSTTNVDNYPDFHKSLTKLLATSMLVFDELENFDLMGEDNSKRKKGITIIKKYASMYCRCYGHTEAYERGIYAARFIEAYNANKDHILGGLEGMAWLSKSDVRIIFATTPQYVALHLSSIFQLAKELRDVAGKKMEKASDDEYNACKANFLTDKIILYIFKIFHSLCKNESERIQLLSVVGTMEENLGSDDNNGDNSNDFSGGLAGITNGIIELMRQNGMVPEGSGVIDDNQIGKAIGGIFGNQGTKNALGGIFSKMKDCNSLSELFTTFASTFQDPNLTQVVQDQIGKVTAERNEAAPILAMGPPGPKGPPQVPATSPSTSTSSTTASSTTPPVANSTPAAAIVSTPNVINTANPNSSAGPPRARTVPASANHTTTVTSRPEAVVVSPGDNVVVVTGDEVQTVSD